MESAWQPVRAENLVRHQSGTIYLQAKIGGKKIRKSLGTSDLKVAKIKRDKMLKTLRAACVAEPSQIQTIGDALKLVADRLVLDPRTKPRTKEFHREIEATLRKSVPVASPAGAWTKDAAVRWWRAFAAARSPEQANKGLAMMRKVAAVAIEAGLRFDDPTKTLKRVKVPVSAVDELPTMETVQSVIADIRGQRKRVSGEAANMVEFFLWSGLRKGELQSLNWEDVGEEWVTIREGKTGRRRVPISGPLREVISRMRHDHAAGPVFKIKTPRLSLGAACRRAGINHLRIHDLRHLFATHAIEAGVDIPTVAKWLGHKDGGALAMRVYGHVRDDHSLKAIGKLG